MPEFVLTFRVNGLSLDDEASIDRCHERCHDITLIERDGVALASFNREADTVEEAIASAVHDLEVALPDACVHSMERELVSSGEIAERAGISREEYPDADIVAVVNAALAEARRGASPPLYPLVLKRLAAVSASAGMATRRPRPA